MIEILNLENVKLARINSKFCDRSYRLTSEYRNFKKLIAFSCKKVTIKPPYRLHISVCTASDIDSHIKPLLDGLELSGVIDNDSNVLEMTIIKKKIKRGQLGSVKVLIESIGD